MPGKERASSEVWVCCHDHSDRISQNPDHLDDFLIVGDSAYGLNGKLTFSAALKPIIKKTSANGLLSGHIEDIPSGLQDML